MRRLTQSLLSAAALALALPSCDNPARVFGGDCSSQGEGGALGGAPASVPSDGEIVLAEPIRSIGVFQVPVKIHKSVDAAVKVYVVRG